MLKYSISYFSQAYSELFYYGILIGGNHVSAPPEGVEALQDLPSGAIANDACHMDAFILTNNKPEAGHILVPNIITLNDTTEASHILEYNT